MTKFLNVIFGISVAVIVFIVALLGIKAFYSEPEYATYCNDSLYSVPAKPVMSFYDCPQNMTVKDCMDLTNEVSFDSEEYKAREEALRVCSDSYALAVKNYNITFFIIASLLGLIAIIVAFFLLDIMSLSTGIAFAGTILIIVAFTKGWNDSNDLLKFVVGVIIGAVVIILALKINNKFSKEENNKAKVTAKKVTKN